MSDSGNNPPSQNSEHLQTIVSILDQLRSREPRRRNSDSHSESDRSEASSNPQPEEREWDALFILASAQRALCESFQILMERTV